VRCFYIQNKLYAYSISGMYCHIVQCTACSAHNIEYVYMKYKSIYMSRIYIAYKTNTTLIVYVVYLVYIEYTGYVVYVGYIIYSVNNVAAF